MIIVLVIFFKINGNVPCMSSGVGRHVQLQTSTWHWKIRRIFQVSQDKPLLIHIVPVAQLPPNL